LLDQIFNLASTVITGTYNPFAKNFTVSCYLRIPLNPATDSTPFRPVIPLIPAKVSERSDAVVC